MSDFPTDAIPTGDVDEGADKAKLGRAVLLLCAQMINSITTSFNQPNGICGLDAAGKVDPTHLPSTFPTGGIIMWSGQISAVPAGWSFCDGTDGTPDLRNRMIIGAAVDLDGESKTTVTTSHTKSGGAVNHTISADELPAHAHGAGTLEAVAEKHYMSPVETDYLYEKYRLENDPVNYAHVSANSAHTHAIEGETAEAGAGQVMSLLNPYYALAFIMKV